MVSAEFQAARKQWKFLRRFGWLIGKRITAKSLRKFMASAPSAPLPEGASATPVDAGGVPSAWVVAQGADPAKRILYLHGGGYVGGNIDTHTALAGYLSQATGMAVLLADYRLAPEHRFPAVLDDAGAAFDWMLQNGPGGPAPASRCVVMGDSAGGGLALGLVLARRDQRQMLPHQVVTLSAWADLTCSSDTMKTRAKEDLVCRQDWLEDCAALYAGDDRHNPYVSPVFGDYGGLPPLFMQVGDAEVLLDDSRKVAAAAKAAGVDAQLEEWPEMLHDWQMMAPTVPEANEAIGKIAAWIAAR